MTEAVALRARLKEIASEDQPVPTFNDMVVKACARALREFPRANGSYRDGHVEIYSRVNVGVAVAAQDALVVPTIFDADRKSLGEIAATSRALAQKVRDGKITPPELSGGTFTVSNLGMFGVTNFAAVINPPQAGAAGGGRARAEAGRRPHDPPRGRARHDGREPRLRSPHPVRRGRRPLPRARARAARAAARARAVAARRLGRRASRSSAERSPPPAGASGAAPTPSPRPCTPRRCRQSRGTRRGRHVRRRSESRSARRRTA